MTVVQSLGRLAAMSDASWYPTVRYGSIRMYNDYAYDYATIYRTQPNVRTCVDFLARNIAQLKLHVYRRISDDDRERLNDHPLAVLLSKPLPKEYKVTYYRLMEALISDMGVYFNAFWLKVRASDGGIGLLRIPPPQVEIVGSLLPTGYKLTLGGRQIPAASSEVVHVRGYNAENPIIGLAPLETLRRILAEEHAAGEHREGFWKSSARQEGIITRPKDAPEWSPEARRRFRDEFQEVHSGAAGSGSTAVLEEGMTWQATQFSSQESEYLAGRKLTREECARAYHIPPPLVGILDHATFSNIKEQHKQLYQDTLGPWLAMVEQDVELQLLTEFDDIEGVYTEFNIAEKLQGSFEEQVKAIQSAVGRPWMAGDEARARFNLPSMGGDMARPVLPLNVMVGGQASPTDSAPESASRGFWSGFAAKADGELDPTLPRLRQRHQEKWAQVLAHTFNRQREAVLGLMRTSTASDIWNEERWNRELSEDLYRLNYATASVWAQHVDEQINGPGKRAAGESKEIDESKMLPWLREHARIQAEEINAATAAAIDQALVEEDPHQAVSDLFDYAVGVRAFLLAVSAVTAVANFGANDAAQQNGLRTKTWRVNSSNPRPEHLALDGTTVDIRGLFPNGMRWPGDPAGGADNNAGCMCSVAFGR